MMPNAGNRRRGSAEGRISERGEMAIEAAFVLPVLVLLMFAVVEFGTAFWQWHTMLRAVERAGRSIMVCSASSSSLPPGCSSCDTTCAETQMQAVLTTASVCTTPSAGQICVSATNTSGTPPTMTLSANYRFNFFGLASPFTITSESTVPLD